MKNSKTVYLANLFAIANSDEGMTRQEWLHIENIRKSLKYTKPELKAAQRLSESKDYTIRQPGSFAYSVQNLEHMLRVAYCDMIADDRELKNLSEYCGLIGLNQEQLNVMYYEVLEDLSKHPEWNEDEKIINEDILTPPGIGFAIIFAESPSPTFLELMARLKDTPIYQSSKDGKRWYMITYDNVEEMEGLRWMFESLKYVRYFLHGVEYDKDEFYSYVACREKRKTAPEPMNHCWMIKSYYWDIPTCVNLIPCGYCEMNISFYRTYEGMWDAASAKQNKLVWIFKKGLMKDRVYEYYSKSNNCPYFDIEKALAIIDKLPDRIIPDNKLWKVHLSSVQDREDCNQSYCDGSLAKIIKVETDMDGNQYNCAQWVDGVEPTGEFIKQFSDELLASNLIEPSIQKLLLDPWSSRIFEEDSAVDNEAEIHTAICHQEQ